MVIEIVWGGPSITAEAKLEVIKERRGYLGFGIRSPPSTIWNYHYARL